MYDQGKIRLPATLKEPIANLPPALQRWRRRQTNPWCLAKAAKDIGIHIDDPFMTLSFVTLAVVPDIKLTDLGLFDVTGFKFVDSEQAEEQYVRDPDNEGEISRQYDCGSYDVKDVKQKERVYYAS